MTDNKQTIGESLEQKLSREDSFDISFDDLAPPTTAPEDSVDLALDAQNSAGVEADDIRSSNTILEKYQTVQTADRDAISVDNETALSEDDIEAELMELRHVIESIDKPLEDLQANDVAVSEAEVVDEAVATLAEDEQDHEPTVADDVATAEVVAPSEDDVIAELLKKDEAEEEYGVNSLRYRPEDYDVASETEAIAPIRINEDDLETVDASDLEAMLAGWDDAGSSSGFNSRGFLDDVAQLDDEDEQLSEQISENLAQLDDAEDFTVDVTADDDLISLDDVDVALDDAVSEALASVAETEIELSDEPVVATVAEVAESPIAETAVELAEEPVVAEPKKAVGLDLSDDGGDPLAWLNKMKAEMAEKFTIDLDEPMPSSQAVSAPVEDVVELDILGDDEPVVPVASVSSDDDEALNLEVFDETSLDLDALATTTAEVSTTGVLLDVEEEVPVEADVPELSEAELDEIAQLTEQVAHLDLGQDQDNDILDVQDETPNAPVEQAEVVEFQLDELDVLTVEDLSASPLTAKPEPDPTDLPQTEELAQLSEQIDNLDLEIFTEDEFDVDSSADKVAPASESADVELAIDDVLSLIDETPVVETARPVADAVDEVVLDLDDTALPEVAPVVETEVAVADVPVSALAETEISGMDELAQASQADEFDVSMLVDLDDLGADEPETVAPALAEVSEEIVDLDISGFEDLPESEATEESVLDKITETVNEWEHNAEEWVEGMTQAVKDKAEELEMRAEILAHEVGDALKHAEEWVEGMAHVVGEKAEELEMRAEIVAHEVVDSVKHGLDVGEPDDLEFSLLDEASQAELLALTQEPETAPIVESEPTPEPIDVAEEEHDLVLDELAELEELDEDSLDALSPEDEIALLEAQIDSLGLELFDEAVLADIDEQSDDEVVLTADPVEILATVEPEQEAIAPTEETVLVDAPVEAEAEEIAVTLDDVAEETVTLAPETPVETTAETATTEPTPTETVAEVATAVAVATVATQALSPEQLEADKVSWATRLKQGLTKSRNQMAKSLAGVFGGGKIDEDLYEELETTLLISDMGIEATEQLMKEVRNRVSLKGLKDGAELRQALKDAVYDLLKPLEQPLVLPENNQPFVIMMAGINGAGKTTSIGKLAKYFQAQGKSVMLAAGDTFRAAAREQLQEWGARNGVTVISQASGDSAAVCFDAVESAKAKGIDVVLADTAGRLPTQLHLMEEIKKVKRVLQKAMPDAPHEIMIVLDANIGQNAINQVVAFDDALGVTGLIVTKLDGTAKGGVLAALASNRPIPVRYIGVGEGIDDLRPFDARAFVDALLDE